MFRLVRVVDDKGVQGTIQCLTGLAKRYSRAVCVNR